MMMMLTESVMKDRGANQRSDDGDSYRPGASTRLAATLVARLPCSVESAMDQVAKEAGS